MATPTKPLHTTSAAALLEGANSDNPFGSKEQQIVRYRKETFPVLVRCVSGCYQKEVPKYEEEISVVICTALENFHDFVEDMRNKFCGPEGEQCVLVNWSGGTRDSHRKISVDKWNFHAVLRMLEARPCSDQVVVGPKELAEYL